jgi:hypothetical protein
LFLRRARHDERGLRSQILESTSAALQVARTETAVDRQGDAGHTRPRVATVPARCAASSGGEACGQATAMLRLTPCGELHSSCSAVRSAWGWCHSTRRTGSTGCPPQSFRVAGSTWVSWFCRYRTRSGQPGSGRRETHPSASGPAPTPTSPSRAVTHLTTPLDNTADGTDPGRQSCAPVDQLTGVESGLPRTPHR